MVKSSGLSLLILSTVSAYAFSIWEVDTYGLSRLKISYRFCGLSTQKKLDRIQCLSILTLSVIDDLEAKEGEEDGDEYSSPGILVLYLDNRRVLACHQLEEKQVLNELSHI